MVSNLKRFTAYIRTAKARDKVWLKASKAYIAPDAINVHIVGNACAVSFS